MIFVWAPRHSESFIQTVCFFFLAFVSPDVNYEELARCTDDFNGAQCKAVCVEAVSLICIEPTFPVSAIPPFYPFDLALRYSYAVHSKIIFYLNHILPSYGQIEGVERGSRAYLYYPRVRKAFGSISLPY